MTSLPPLLLLLLHLLSVLLSPAEPFLLSSYPAHSFGFPEETFHHPHPPHRPPKRKQGEVSSSEEPCHFPFRYKRKLYYSCVPGSFLNPQHWCATTENYDRDRKWRPCRKEERPRGHCDSNPCQNGGACEARQSGFHCICPAGFYGQHCQKESCSGTLGLLHIGQEDVWLRHQPAGLEECHCAGKKLKCKHIRAKACLTNPCLNGGLCIELKHKRRCGCPEQFSGPLCDIDHTQICYSGNGQTYRGMANLGYSGTPCLPWDSPILAEEYTSSLENAVSQGLGEHAFCRNPDNDSQPWCYVLRDMQLSWEFCNVTRCHSQRTGDADVITGLILNVKPELKPPNKTESSSPPLDTGPAAPICGQRYTKIASSRKRIVGGMVALPDSHPYIAAMYLGDQFCGGSLIASCWILTAAHCFEFRPNVTEISIVLGQTRYNSSTDSTRKLQVQYYQMHENYSEITKQHDIALVKLKEKTPGHCVEFSHSISPVCLPSASVTPDAGKQCQIAGWGHMYEGADKLALYLQEADIPIIPHEKCSSREVHGTRITEDMLCAGFLDGRSDACQGDSGGPLACEDQGKVVQHGIISWGTGCALENKPGVYTNVAHYLNWIQSHMHEQA